MVSPDPGRLVQYRFPARAARLLNEAVDGFTNELALPLAFVPGDSGKFVVLVFRQVDPCTHH